MILSAWWRKKTVWCESGMTAWDGATKWEGGTSAQDETQRREGRTGVVRWLSQPMFMSMAAVLALYLLWQGPVLSALHVEPPDTIESLTMPTQHLLCAYQRGGCLTAEQIDMLERVVPLAKIDEYYNPYLFDMTKNYIRQNGHQEVIAENKGAYAKLWLMVGLRNPMLYLEEKSDRRRGIMPCIFPMRLIFTGIILWWIIPLASKTRESCLPTTPALLWESFYRIFRNSTDGCGVWERIHGFFCFVWLAPSTEEGGLRRFCRRCACWEV